MQLPAPRINDNAMALLIKTWQASPEWGKLADKTKYDWSRYCQRINERWGNLEVRGIEPQHVLALRDEYQETPAAANNLLRCLSSMLAWSVPRGWRSDNPCREVPPFPKNEGYSPWPWELIEIARQELPARLWQAVALALYTGQRQSDILAMRWDALSHGAVSLTQKKTGRQLTIPIHRDLQAVIDQIPRDAVTILTNSNGKPWTVSGFKASWNKAKPDALSGYQFHGLRKSAVVTLLEAGCTDAQAAAITGQSRDMIEHYARKVNQTALAKEAMRKWESGAGQNENRTNIVSTLVSTGKNGRRGNS